MIYLDNAATTWPKPESVYEAVNHCFRRVGASPGRGNYPQAWAAGNILFTAREELAGLFSVADSSNIAFTYNGTDAINMALFGLLRPGDHVVTTAWEHNAVARPLRYLEGQGLRLTVIGSAPDGTFDLAGMAAVIAQGVRAVVMTHASNVTGEILPVGLIGALTRAEEALLIVDAAQTAGVEPLAVEALGIDVLALTGHKGLFGPQGTGAIYVRPGIKLRPLRFGGTGSLSECDQQPDFMPDRLESGTPNTPGIAGLAAGAAFVRDVGVATIRARERGLTRQLLAGLQMIPRVTIHGPLAAERRTAAVSFSLAGQDSGAVAYRLSSEFDIACRAGLHCAPWAHQTLGTLQSGTIRFSLGWFTTETEIDQALAAVATIVKKEVK